MLVVFYTFAAVLTITNVRVSAKPVLNWTFQRKQLKCNIFETKLLLRNIICTFKYNAFGVYYFQLCNILKVNNRMYLEN